VPVTVSAKVPVAAEALADSVSVLLAAVGLGMNEAVTPLGKPEAVRFTLVLKPFTGLTEIVLVAPVP